MSDVFFTEGDLKVTLYIGWGNFF